jgi:hypothetical protein
MPGLLTMFIGDIPTELLLKMRDRLLSGRTRLSALLENQEWLAEVERRMIEALENELRLRLH